MSDLAIASGFAFAQLKGSHGQINFQILIMRQTTHTRMLWLRNIFSYSNYKLKLTVKMKTTTKLKVINFVKRVLKYTETTQINLKTNERKIVDLKVNLSVKAQDFEKYDMVEDLILKEFCKELKGACVINVKEVEFESFDRGHSIVPMRRLEATLSVVK